MADTSGFEVRPEGLGILEVVEVREETTLAKVLEGEIPPGAGTRVIEIPKEDSES
jgi:hypothetical protein